MKVRLTAATLVILVGLTTAPFVLAQDDKQPDSKPAPDPTQTQPNSKPDSKPAATDAQPAALPDVVPQKEHVDVKQGSKDDVEAIGNRDMGKRGMGNWYSLESEIRMGKQYAQQIDATV